MIRWTIRLGRLNQMFMRGLTRRMGVVDKETIAREVGFILETHGQQAARAILFEAVIRIGLNDGLPAGIQAARDVVTQLEGHEPLLL